MNPRRCDWCAIRLRWWERGQCRECSRASSEAGIYLQNGGPPFRQGSRRGVER